ncbi:MAG TPA: hypothetical protein VN328_05860, partial [Thermodesulfovibrionales bacterium]|nr:hypothetical protein [Thermodesulfovibrionales bacterium]
EHALVLQNGAFHATEKVNSLPIPGTIRDVLTARMDRLDEQSRDLLKVASVIGRAFLRRILLEVAPSVEELDAKLSHFQDIQFIRERTRWGETEYLFNHALVQETTYESILLLKRKELHLKVAQAIESLFELRLHEFYGMLAYHYSMAESSEKTEEYLIKAGEEALRSAAPDEALHYYEEALRLYQEKSGKDADLDKVAMIEKNIGLALFNRGHYAEAVDHFDKSLNYYWGELPKNSLSRTLKFFFSFTTFILALYFPSLWFKRIATIKDAESLGLLYKKGEALAVINPKRFFVECFFFYNTLVHFDLTKFSLGIGVLAAASSLFSFTGLSFSIGRRILDYAKPRLTPDNAKQLIVYDLMDTQHHFLNGRWNEITECNEDLVMRNLRIGEMFYVSQHYYWHGLPELYRGNFDQVGSFVTKLNEIAEAYDNDIYRLLKYLLNIQLLFERRQLRHAAEEVNRGIDLVQKKGWQLSRLTMHSLETSIHLQMKETEKAENSLDLANQIRSEVKAFPLQLSFFYRSQFEYDIRRLEEAFANGLKNEASKHLKNASTSGKMLMKTCRKAALCRTEFFRLMGVYGWLISDRKSAMKWWQKAVSEGESLCARPHLSRVHHEIAKRLSCSEGADPRFVHGSAREHLVKAEKMFREMGLREDFQELVALFGKSE